MQDAILTVSALNDYVRRLLASDHMLKSIVLRGEISNFKLHVSGHWYFSLKDENSRIACVMFRQHNMSAKFIPKDGMRILLTGTVGLYTASGSYQFYGESIRKDGVGELYERYLQLKEMLTAEGLFDVSRKKNIPLLPRAVGIITSSTGAVLHDIQTVAYRRWPGVQLILRPSLVQGEGAAADLVKALAEMAAVDAVDVVIIGRGGGSMEDLWAFNEEPVVRAIAACPVPVIAAIGHETDVTLSDFAADVRAATPSAAAELAVPNKLDLIGKIDKLRLDLHFQASRFILQKKNGLNIKEKRLLATNPLIKCQTMQNRVKSGKDRLITSMKMQMQKIGETLRNQTTKLYSVGPNETLKRGYVIALSSSGFPITSSKNTPDQMELMFHDGKVLVAKQKHEEDK